MNDYKQKQVRRRAEMFAAHQRTIDEYWDDTGRAHCETGYRVVLGHCASYLAGDAACVEKANRIIVAHRTLQPCHFAPSAAIDLLHGYRDRLTAEATDSLEQYLYRNIPYMATDDLRVYGYNDNHPIKAMHALIVGGEMLGSAENVEIGLRKMREAMLVFRRNGFPSEYNSPNYTIVSIKALADIVEQAENSEARELALRLEHFFWQDMALHFDSVNGLPAGPYSRGYVNDYSGLLSATVWLLAYLFPERFDFDVIHEVFDLGAESTLFEASKPDMPFFQYHLAWYAYPTYHLTPAIEEALFSAKPAGAYVRGAIESGTFCIGWDPAENRPAGAPSMHRMGPRSGLISTYFGDGYTLGTAQYSWLDNVQSHGFYATVSTGPKVRPQDVAIYYARMFFDERSPHGEAPYKTGCFRDDGEIRTLQHRNSAMVFYNPVPYFGRFSRLHTGIFRSLKFSEPREIYVGETPVSHLNGIYDTMKPIAIRDGDAYLGFIPLRLTDLGQKRGAHLQIQTYSDHLAILISSLESWQPRDFSYETILGVCSGFVCEIRSTNEISSFAEFRRFLADARIDDRYRAGQFANQRESTYSRDGLTLSAAYSPFHSAFRYTTVNGEALPQSLLQIEGMPDPRYAIHTQEGTR